MLTQALAFVDLETTGATAAVDRITEIGIVEVDTDGSVREWQQLVNPGVTISPFIEQLTGISNAMVATAPSFAEVAEEAEQRLKGRLFVAHNARFDYGFLKAEFQRMDRIFRSPTLCTVKLSRALFPEHKRHNLDALVERHRLQADTRHRALADARLIHQFWNAILDRPGPEAVRTALRLLDHGIELPAHLGANLVNELPEEPGVYLLYGADEQLLFVGHGKDVRKRILWHFTPKAPTRRKELAALVQRVEWQETLDVVTASLREADLIARLQPRYNKPARHQPL